MLVNVKRRVVINICYPPDEDKEHSHHYKWGYFNKNFQIAIPPAYDYARSFSEGLAAVQVGKKWGYIDIMGSMVIKPQFYYAEDFTDGIAKVGIKNTDAYINRDGKIIWPHEEYLVVN